MTLIPNTLEKVKRRINFSFKLTRLQLSPTILNSKCLLLWAERRKTTEENESEEDKIMTIMNCVTNGF